MTLLWTWGFIALPAVMAGAVFAMYHGLGWHFLALPASALAILGTAVSFYLGFKGNAAYGRLWEARKIWGGIVNSSRTWGVFTKDYITTHFAANEEEQHELEAVHLIEAFELVHIGRGSRFGRQHNRTEPSREPAHQVPNPFGVALHRWVPLHFASLGGGILPSHPVSQPPEPGASSGRRDPGDSNRRV